MKKQNDLNKKTWFCLLIIMLFAVGALTVAYFLLPIFFPNLSKPVQMAVFMVIFLPPLYFFIKRQLEHFETQVLNASKDIEMEKCSLFREIDEQEERYQVLVENSPVGILTCDRNGVIVMVNPAVVKLLGSPSEAATKEVNVFTFPPLVESGIANHLKHCVETGEMFRGEAVYTSKWGKVVYLRMHFVPLHDYNGKIAGVQGIVEDFTEYKKAQDQLRTYYHAIEHSPVAVLISDDQGIIEYINPQYTKVTGYTPADLIGKNVESIYAGNNINKVYQELRNTVTAGKVWQKEHRNVKKNGESYWENISISPVFDENGDIYHYVSVKEDITARREESEHAKYLAYHDTLTGLANRGLFNDRLMISVANAARYQSRMAVMYMDLDCFKEINDSFGHDVGDELLKGVAARIKSVIRKGDTLARMGGDEFTLIIPDFEDVSDVEAVAEKIIKAMEKPVTQKNLQITVSIGVAVYPNHGTNHESLLLSADKAMYQAKNAGKNNYRFYAPEK
jgi:diguanylate cyclase (GGDEF)-like protein/PAS domain S-box-containing protein